MTALPTSRKDRCVSCRTTGSDAASSDQTDTRCSDTPTPGPQGTARAWPGSEACCLLSALPRPRGKSRGWGVLPSDPKEGAGEADSPVLPKLGYGDGASDLTNIQTFYKVF